jgi:hypothetical protein
MELSVDRENLSVDIDDGLYHVAEHTLSHALELAECRLLRDYLHRFEPFPAVKMPGVDYKGMRSLGKM